MPRPDERTDKTLFDFLTSPSFKANLFSDYDELQASVKNGQWKAAHVLAGSIIEAILIDYLIAVNHEGKSEEDLLKLDMGKLITAGKAQGILSEKTASLCAVIKDYRNLIHPGRLVRLQEIVAEEGATVALALMKMVAKDIGKKKAEVYGYTAEQLTTKIEIDPACTSYLPFIVKEMKSAETRRLLLEVLPARNYEYTSNPTILADSSPHLIRDTKSAFSMCFRMVRDQADISVQEEVLHQYVSILKEDAKAYRECYEDSFFRCGDLEWIALPPEIDLIRGHILGRLSKYVDTSFLVVAAGIGKYITVDDVHKKAARALWVPFSKCEREDEIECLTWFKQEHANFVDYVREEFDKDMSDEAKSRSIDLTNLSASIKALISNSLPF